MLSRNVSYSGQLGKIQIDIRYVAHDLAFASIHRAGTPRIEVVEIVKPGMDRGIEQYLALF